MSCNECDYEPKGLEAAHGYDDIYVFRRADDNATSDKNLTNGSPIS